MPRKVRSPIDNAVNQVLGQRGKGIVSYLVKVGVRQLPADENGSEGSLEDGSSTTPSGLE